MTIPRLPLRGEVWVAQLDPVIGHEQGGKRPILVVSDDRLNRSPRALVAAVPLTSRIFDVANRVRLQPPEGGIRLVSDILCDQVRTLSHLRLTRHMGTVSPSTMALVEARLAHLFMLQA